MSEPQMIPKQETFDTVVTFLRRQGRPSVFPHPFMRKLPCAYRSNDGCKCAAGVLIPDHLYSPSMEGTPAGSPFQPVGELLASLGYNLELVGTLQQAHDELAAGDWKSTFSRTFGYLADSWGLSRRVLEDPL